MEYIVALETFSDNTTTFIAPWNGDPGRTCMKINAKRYKSISSATYALAKARKYRDFLTARIQEVRE